MHVNLMVKFFRNMNTFSGMLLYLSHCRSCSRPTAIEICIGVTTLTFHCHVTSSVTWPFNSHYAVSYKWYFDTFSLSGTGHT